MRAHSSMSLSLTKGRKVNCFTRVLSLEEFERNHILKVLERTGWRVSGDQGVAKMLGLKPTTLGSRMVKLGIKRK